MQSQDTTNANEQLADHARNLAHELIQNADGESLAEKAENAREEVKDDITHHKRSLQTAGEVHGILSSVVTGAAFADDIDYTEDSDGSN